MEYIFLILGILIGGIIGILYIKSLQKNLYTEDELNETYIRKELYIKATEDNEKLKKENELSNNEIIRLNKIISANEQIIENLNQRLTEQKKDIDDLQNKFKTEFENIANRLLEEKSEKFVKENIKNLDIILNPFKEKIDEFRKKIEETHLEDVKERSSLKTEIKHLVELNKQVSEDATNLSKALKGDSKMQGDWGEIQLEMILEKAGLQKDIHYKKQMSLEAIEGSKYRPDFIILLPENKHIIIDSKVSLTAYENYFNSDDDASKNQYLLDHISSITKHIKELSAKNYQLLYQINPPDFVLMFVPIEPALTLVFKNDIQIFDKALEKNIILVTPSTLLATLRTVAFIWKQENQKRNVITIASEAGLMYDKFEAFVQDLIKIGKELDTAKNVYEDAMKKLYTGKGNLVRRAEKILQLGATATKRLPQNLIERTDLNNEED